VLKIEKEKERKRESSIPLRILLLGKKQDP
jgi:hypothetical protein